MVLANRAGAIRQYLCGLKLVVSTPSLRQRIRTKLELYDLGLCPFTAFDVEGRPVAEDRPQTFTFQPALGSSTRPFKKTAALASVDL
jgi:hypothetical protein